MMDTEALINFAAKWLALATAASSAVFLIYVIWRDRHVRSALREMQRKSNPPRKKYITIDEYRQIQQEQRYRDKV